MSSTPRSPRALSIIALVSLVYDVAIGVLLAAGRGWLARTFAVPSPDPPIFAELCALFTIAVGVGYVLPYLHPDEYRGYLGVMGPLLKGGGALVFVADHLAHATPSAFLLFALTDGVLALVTLWALLVTRASRHDGAAVSPGRAESRRP